jgi:hypothetical protein
LIVDGVYKWAPDGNTTETNLKLQGEFFIGRSHGLFDGLDYSATQTGFYAQAIYQRIDEHLGAGVGRIRACGARTCFMSI